MTYGLDATGFRAPTLAEIVADIEADELATIDSLLDTSPDQPVGQLNGIFAKKLVEAWEALQTAYGAYDDTQAEGYLLDALSALTGTVREGDTKGLCVVNCTLASGTVLGTTAMVGNPADASNRWTLLAAFTAPSTGSFPLVFQCTQVGAVPALAGTLTQIVTPVTGWSGATNALDATPGALADKDSALRIRRRSELRGQGTCTAPAIQAALLKTSGVIAATVIENTGVVPDGAGRPAKSMEAIVWDGVSPAAADSAIRTTLYANKPGGIEYVGSNSGTILDAYGKIRTVPFSRATQVPITIALTVLTDSTFPGDGVARITAAIDAAGLNYGMGMEVVRLAIMALALGITGVIDVPVCTINGTTGNVTIGATSIATFDSGRITVTVT